MFGYLRQTNPDRIDSETVVKASEPPFLERQPDIALTRVRHPLKPSLFPEDFTRNRQPGLGNAFPKHRWQSLDKPRKKRQIFEAAVAEMEGDDEQ